jgi:hypothetical protein
VLARRRPDRGEALRRQERNNVEQMSNPTPSVNAQDSLSLTHKPPRPFKSRGGKSEHAAYKHQWYLDHRQAILETRSAEYAKVPKKLLTPDERTKSNRKMAATKRRGWKNMPATKRKRVLQALKDGMTTQQEQLAGRRREWAWEAVKERLNGGTVRPLIRKYGKGVLRVLRDGDIPRRKKFVCDRGVLFTRGEGTKLRSALGYTGVEFAKRISTTSHAVSEKRPLIWLTHPEKSMEPAEARECVALRSRVAAKLLADDTVRGLSNLDGYDRGGVLVTLFPRLRMENFVLLKTVPALIAFLKSRESSCSEKEVGDAVFDLAAREKRGEMSGDSFRTLLRWPELVPWITANQERLRAEVVDRFKTKQSLIFDLLAHSCSCSPKVVKAAVSYQKSHVEPRRMRELIRRYFPDPAANLPAAASVSGTRKPRKYGPDKKPAEQSMWFEIGRKVEGLVASGESLIDARRRVVGKYEYDTVVRYHRQFRAWRRKNPSYPG